MLNIHKPRLIIISGRFRSGTSMLWNLFNQLPQYCAFYEPLHPNLINHIKHVKPKEDHQGVDDYWRSYSSCKDIEKFHSRLFGQSRLYLEKHDKWQKLDDYIHYLIDSSQDKTPVLQFNRMDLRLSWLKNNYPEALIINIQREPQSLFFSQRKHISDQKYKFNESYPDAYDLMQWSAALAKQFPMLQSCENRHAYFRHYFIWKLSTQMASSHADIKLDLIDDFFNSQNGINYLSQKLNWDKKTQTQLLKSIIKPLEVKKNNDSELLKIEKQVNTIFNNSGLQKNYPSSPLASLKLEYKNYWPQFKFDSQVNIQELLDAINYQKDEQTRLLSKTG